MFSTDCATTQRAARAKKLIAANLDNGVSYCACKVYEHAPRRHPQQATVDHFPAVTRGGTHEDGLALSCFACKRSRSNHLGSPPRLGPQC
jgi:hypothetical protein